MTTQELIENKKITIESIQDISLLSKINQEALEGYLFQLSWNKYEENPNPDMQIYIKERAAIKHKIEFLKTKDNQFHNLNKLLKIIKIISEVEDKSELVVLFQLTSASELYHNKNIVTE